MTPEWPLVDRVLITMSALSCLCHIFVALFLIHLIGFTTYVAEARRPHRANDHLDVDSYNPGIHQVEAIGCFVCTSINHSTPDCEDRFNNTGKYYVHNCWATRKNRIGTFPGTQCIKLTALDPNTGVSILVRDCVTDNGGTSESEIGRQSHCGWIREMKLDGRSTSGCLVVCNTHACNRARRKDTRVLDIAMLFLVPVSYFLFVH